MENRHLFEHSLYPKLNIVNHDTTQGRFYSIPGFDIKLPSVTTVLDNTPHFDRKNLERWRKRPGSQEILQQARNRGSAVHRILENYILNDPDYLKNEMPINIYSFNTIKKFLDNHCEIVYGIELPLYSLNLKTAGRSDIIMDWKGKKTVFDLKSSKKQKEADKIPHYFVQATCYALMMNELYGENITNIVVAMIVDDGNPLLFEEKTENFLELTHKIFTERNYEIPCPI